MKLTKIIMVLALTALIVTGCGKDGKESDKRVTDAELVHQLQDCSRIYTSEYQISKIIVQKDEKRIQGKILGIDMNIGIAGGKRVIAVPVKGIFKGYVDMSELKAENVRRRGDSIEVILPDPKIELTGTRITAQDVKEKIGILQHKFTDEELTALQRQGRDSLIAEVPELGLIDNARENAARTLMTLLTAMGYDEDKVRITFRKDLRSMSAPEMIKDMLVSTVD